jgi:hypothetical protein
MEKERMSITRGLRELKLLDDRIMKTISEMKFVDVFQGKNPGVVLISKKQKTVFESDIKEKIQSYDALLKRRTAIKSAIMKSNSESKIKIAGKEYFVIDAIEKKSSLKYDKEFLKKMRNDWVLVSNNIESNRVNIENQVNTIVTQAFGADKKNDKETYDNIAKPFIEANELKLVNPVDIYKRIEELDKEIVEFEAEVDFILSESNAKVEIEIEV